MQQISTGRFSETETHLCSVSHRQVLASPCSLLFLKKLFFRINCKSLPWARVDREPLWASMVPCVHVEVASLKSCVQRLAPSGGGGVPKSIDKEKNCSYEGHLWKWHQDWDLRARGGRMWIIMHAQFSFCLQVKQLWTNSLAGFGNRCAQHVDTE